MHGTTTRSAHEHAVIEGLSPAWHQGWRFLNNARTAQGWSWLMYRWWRRESRRTIAQALVITLMRPHENQPIVLDWLLEAGSPLWTTDLGATPLMAAMGYASEDVAERLLNLADPSGQRRFSPMIPGDGALSGGASPKKVHLLVLAAERGFERLVTRLLPAHRDDQALLDEALGRAAQAGHLAVMDRLLPEVKHPSYGGLLHAVEQGQDAVVERLVPRAVSMPLGPHDEPVLLMALQAAVQHGRTGTLQRLLHDAEPALYVNTDLLHDAASLGHVEDLRALMATMSPQRRNWLGQTPLMTAAGSRHNTLAVIDVLLPVSNPEAQDTAGNTAFVIAAYGRCETPFHWDRVDRLALHEPDQACVRKAVDLLGPEHFPRWTTREEQAALRSAMEHATAAPPRAWSRL